MNVLIKIMLLLLSVTVVQPASKTYKKINDDLKELKLQFEKNSIDTTMLNKLINGVEKELALANKNIIELTERMEQLEQIVQEQGKQIQKMKSKPPVGDAEAPPAVELNTSPPPPPPPEKDNIKENKVKKHTTSPPVKEPKEVKPKEKIPKAPKTEENKLAGQTLPPNTEG